MDFTNLLNKEQLKGVTTDSKYVRVIAGAGSGKTRVLTYRIAHLLANELVLPYQILAWTFTNKAAKEIKERVTKICGEQKSLFLGTIHSWCAAFLRREASYINYPKSFSILDEEDSLSVMKEVFVNNGFTKSDPKIKQCIGWISSKKTNGYQYKDIKDNEIPNQELKLFMRMFGEYTQILEDRKSLDFDDLLLKTIEILRNYDEVRNKYCRYIKYILVDEFQDINDVQFDLITLLMDEETSLYVVGDPDQTIYTWRGANHRIILNLEDSLKEIDSTSKVETIILDKNYRSTKEILKASNMLIEHNNERIKKVLEAVNEDGEKVKFYNARTNKEETHYIVSTILDLKKNKNVNLKDIVVLYRANYLTRELETTLSSYRIKYKVFGGQKFFQRKEIKDVLAYFRLLINDLDDTAFDRVINVPKRGMGPTTLERIVQASEEMGQTKFSYLRENINEAPVTVKQKASLVTMIKGINELRTKMESIDELFVQELHDFIVNDLGYFNYLKEDDDNTWEDRRDNVEELFTSLRLQLIDDPTLTFEEFVNSAMLQSSQDEVSEGDYVSLMTVHTAKGLEYDYVFVYSLGEGVFPSQRAVLESRRGIEEERRLAYVAFTRAKKRLYLSSNQDYNFSVQGPLRPSRFIKEAGLISDDRFTFGRREEQPFYKPQGMIKKDIAPKPQIDMRKTNGVDKWNVGDRVNHEKLGNGVVVEILNQLIVIKFDDTSLGKKTFLGSHIAIKKL